MKDDTGAPVAGATVRITSVDRGTERTAKTSASGNFLVNGLSIGSYNVRVDSASAPTWRTEGVRVLSAQTAELNIQLASAGGQEIVVTAARAATAFTGTTTGLNVDVEDFIKTKPLGRDLTSIILLAPGTTVGNSSNSTFNGLPSIGGSSVAENAYYFNGLNLTNFDNYLGSATVPFYFYRNVETKTGGAPAEYGRATGGMINTVSKSGSNEFTAAMHVDWSPNFLRSRGRNLTQFSDGELVQTTNNAATESESLLTTIEAGGPIIKDRLFVYGLAQFQRTRSVGVNPLSGTASRSRNDDPFWGAKIDAYPIDSQHLEFTIFDTRATRQVQSLDYSYVDGVSNFGAANSINDYHTGGLNFVGKYTGRMTDWLTVSAAYGRVRDRFDYTNVAGDTTTPAFYNSSGETVYGVPNGGYFNDQRLSSIVDPYDTERKALRADADVLFSLFGDHHLRVGYDQEINTLRHVTVNTGGLLLSQNGLLSDAALNAQLGNAGYQIIARAPDDIGPIVELNYFNTGGAFKAKNQAYYIQDEWKPTDRLTLNLGVRRDDFRINKPSGAPITDLKKNYAPRLGATYQLFDDNSGQLFGSYSWYYLPVASNTAYRQGAPSYYFRQRWHFSGVDSNGLPILTSLVDDQGTYQSACPFALISGGPTTNCNVTGDGADIDTTQGVASNLKATRQSEIIIGYRQKLGLWTFGLNWTHRNLDRTAEDSSVDAAINAYCEANDIVATPTGGGTAVPCSDIWTGFHQYVINNPGKEVTVNLLANGYDINGQQVTLTADQLGYGKATRKYDAITFSFDRAWDGRFSLGGSYTWSKSRGNSEGFVQSDFGQVDAGITQDFDQPGFVDYAYGYLPNDHRHLIKLYGNVSLDDRFSIGLNTQISSPSPLSCFGFHPTDAFANGYGSASHFCGGEPSPRGEAQKSDWYSTFNFSFQYAVPFGDREVRLRGDVFNLFNSQAVMSRDQTGDLDVVTGDDGLPASYISNPNYGLATAYQSPRYVRLGFDISF